ncbi:MAG: UPF0182 family protein [Deltaproteobacteria bacterium]|nr:UPF0182 family protein [Deltaproteobacteria bacterium]MBW2043277.1 UPF0182 family protein [Deltaproteobacteria bacterium]MBW2299974.1 UPF0182 family protein [Deltaproteobacteria bacterium]
MKKGILVGIVVLVLALLWWGISIYPDWLWFGKLHYSSVFWTKLVSEFGLGLLTWLLLMVMVILSLYVARRLSRDVGPSLAYGAKGGISLRSSGLLILAVVLIIGFFIASKGASQWDMVLRYLNQQAFGVKDPVFGKDIGFYVFSLPLYLFIERGLILFVVITGIVTGFWYLRNGAIQLINMSELVQDQANRQPTAPKMTMSSGAKRHFVFLVGIIILLIAWGYYLKRFNLLYSTAGAAFGAAYTDVHIRIYAYEILAILSVAFAVFLFVSAFRAKAKLIWTGGAIWIASIFLFSSILPLLVQKFVVSPNELAKESTYIARNILYTRNAYDLNKIKEVPFRVGDRLTAGDVRDAKPTIQNIRIWDKRPLLRTYNQLQSIRLYYTFRDVDVDRYQVNGDYRQLMLSARELDVRQLPPQARTWVNRHLIYTHGYGLTSSTVNDVTSEGLPDLIIKDLPPSVAFDIKIDHPEIYYGEKTENYVFVKTKTKEFDYPKGDANIYTNYKGSGGVPIGSFLRRLLFSFEFLDPQILFTRYLGPESRIMYNRRIDRRVRAIAPFLSYDSDPYLVISGGRLYWIQDAYTTSNMYPYSKRFKSNFNTTLNYIRNSVKVVIDAYSGDVSFFVVDEKDPIVRTYSKIFPELFKPFAQMPADLKKHVRYPKDLFRVQSQMYMTYHMKDVQVFYNQEDLWQIPGEVYGDSRQKMEPYYIIIRLPGEENEEFVLMLPFTPSNKDNMIAWLAARCDVPNYGHLIVYKLPKEKLVFGPMQIEARVDQQTQISREMTLWGQRGSVVIRGNLLAIPIKDTFIYVEPVYLEAKQTETQPAPTPSTRSRGLRRSRAGSTVAGSAQSGLGAAGLPELKRVIVAFGNRVVMKRNLEDALLTVLEGKEPLEQMISRPPARAPEAGASAKTALEHFLKAKQYLKEGDWAGYGRELRALEDTLNEMAQKEK